MILGVSLLYVGAAYGFLYPQYPAAVFSGTPDVTSTVPPSRSTCAMFCERKSPSDCAGFSYSEESRSCRLFRCDNLATESSDQQPGVKSYSRAIARHPSGLPCPEGWQRLEGHCYILVNAWTTWTEAEQDCVSRVDGGHLANWWGADWWSAMKQMFPDYINSGRAWAIWMGVRRETTTSPWLSVDGSPVGVINWGPNNNPNNRPGEDYLKIDKDGKAFDSYDVSDFAIVYFCQVPEKNC